MRELNIDFIKGKYPNGFSIENDLLLYDSTTGLPTLTETSRMKCLLLAICTGGEVEYTVDTVIRKVSSNDVLIVSEGQVIGDYKMSADAKGVCLLLSYDFFQEIVSNVKELTTLFLFARRHPVFHAEDNLVSELLNYIQAVKLKILDLQHEFRRELVATMLKVLIYDMCNVIYRVQQVEKTGKSRGETIFSDFIRLVEKEYRSERRVSWYAEQLYISPKYLSETIKHISKRTPSEWIDYYVMMEIRVLLRNSKMSIKQIAEELHFPNQSFLGKYFKDRYGKSPSQFRRS
ncbi:helix-turn-helix domain-containing protein [Prevotella falsenii]|uniref:helix-turn-helix domain-containing protein n=1 Tax=Prevotella falsenii TaxID=515414 RepID=UPI00046ABDC5|nr:helix-turn-helix domain-containing protein [Prevotella falsenii]